MEEVRERTREFWSGGDYARVARLIEPVAAEVVRASGVSAGHDVLDVAAGNGNVAVRAARAGARVVASDLTPAMIALGRERTRAEGLDIAWVEADVEELPFTDASFDRVLSVFGAMFAPHPERAAAEMFRVLRPGGALALAGWTREGFVGDMIALNRAHGLGPPSAADPLEWGDEEAVRARLGGHAAHVAAARQTVRYGFPSLEAMRDFFERSSPQSASARGALSGAAHAEVHRASQALVQRHNRATDGSVEIHAEYLLVVAHRGAGASGPGGLDSRAAEGRRASP